MIASTPDRRKKRTAYPSKIPSLLGGLPVVGVSPKSPIAGAFVCRSLNGANSTPQLPAQGMRSSARDIDSSVNLPLRVPLPLEQLCGDDSTNGIALRCILALLYIVALVDVVVAGAEAPLRGSSTASQAQLPSRHWPPRLAPFRSYMYCDLQRGNALSDCPCDMTRMTSTCKKQS